MWSILKQILTKWACKHDWKLEEVCKHEYTNILGEVYAWDHQHTYICKKCGKFQQIKV